MEDYRDVTALFEELMILIDSSKPVFGKPHLRQIDYDETMSIIEEIQDAFPREFSMAKQIVREKEALIEEATIEHDRLIEDARSQAITIASDQEIVRISHQQAESIMLEARELEREVRAGAEDYAESVFVEVEQTLESVLQTTKRSRDHLNANSRQGY